MKNFEGTLPDGTSWLIKVPPDWNGTLLRDLDFASFVGLDCHATRYRDLLGRGYAFAGLARHPLRMWQYDPQREIGNLERVQANFAERVGVPDRVLQYGCSGGGFVGLASAEAFSDGIDGAVVLSAHIPVWIMGSFLDGWFAMKALLADDFEGRGLGAASDLQLAGFSNEGASAIAPSPDVQAPWRPAIEMGSETPEGRARLALAFAVGQWSPWMVEGTELPDPADAAAMGEMIARSALRNAGNVGGTTRLLFENAASGQQLSGNEAVDYAAFYANAAPAMKDIVETLYAAAGLDVAADLERINAQPRIAASDYALDFWSKPGRTATGDLKVPVMRIHALGDWAIPYSLMQGYRELVAEKGTSDLYRQALLERTAHCEFTQAENAAAVDTLVKRLETGSWPDTSAQALNARAAELSPDSSARFIEPDGWQVGAYNRPWTPAD